MKLNCNVIQDLLPLYHDGVCSDESRALVESHVAGCEACRGLLRELRGEIEVPHGEPDDLGAMKKLEANVKKGRKHAWIKGVAAALAVVLVLGAAAAGVYLHESNQYRMVCLKFTEGHEEARIQDEDYPYDYEWVHGNYRFRVNVPETGEHNGTVQVREFKWTKDLRNPNDLIQISLSVQFSDEDGYLYQIAIENGGYTVSAGLGELEETDWSWETVTLDQNGQTVHDESWDDETIARKDALIEAYRTEILNIITAAEREWPFLLE